MVPKLVDHDLGIIEEQNPQKVGDACNFFTLLLRGLTYTEKEYHVLPFST